MFKIISLVLILPLLFVNALISNAFAKDKKFVISYVEHESIIKYYVPLLDAAYRSIGIEPDFVLINDKRALKLLDKGEIDADTAKTSETLNNYSNIVKLPTAIGKIETTLICQENIICDLSILNDNRKILGVIGAKEFYGDLLKGSNISLVEFTSFEVLFKVFEQKKVDYAFTVFDEYNKISQVRYPNSFIIEEKIGFHLLNEKHKKLIPLLEKAIKDTLAKGDFINEEIAVSND